MCASGAQAGVTVKTPCRWRASTLGQHVKQIERWYIAQALEKTSGRKTKAAELLGMSFRSFRYFMKKYDLG